MRVAVVAVDKLRRAVQVRYARNAADARADGAFVRQFARVVPF